MSTFTITEPWRVWSARRCHCCNRHGVTGIFRCHFRSGRVEVLLLCARCALYDAAHKWYGPSLTDIDLLVTLTTDQTVVDALTQPTTEVRHVSVA